MPVPQQSSPWQKRNREPSGTHDNWEQDVSVWTVVLDYGPFLAQVWVPVEKSRLFWITHTAETRAASLTCISDPARRELWVHQCWTYGCTTSIYDYVTKARLLYITFSCHWKWPVYVALKLNSHWCKSTGGQKLQWNGIQCFPLKRSICCAAKESSKMNSGACSEVSGMQKAVSNHPVYHPHEKDFISPLLNSAEVKSWLEKPRGQATALFGVMRLDTVLAAMFSPVKEAPGIDAQFLLKINILSTFAFLWKNSCKFYVLKRSSHNRKSCIIQGNK